MKKRVVVGISGGVDSAVAALLLKEQGYEVIGLFMKNWEEESLENVCTAENDYEDIKMVCEKIDIPYYTVNFAKEYWNKVFSHFLEEYKKGRTPNPDVLCNREIKFAPFKEQALKLGADYIATGHYAGILDKWGKTYLTRAKDENKDQTYFLNQLTNNQIRNVIFPLENLMKPEVREIAKQHNLINASKKDSTGICFIGERNFREFLTKYIPMKKGEIKTLDNKVVGEHKGVFYYTMGQRNGFGIGGAGNGEPWFIVGKDVEKNILYVNQGEPETLFSDTCLISDFNYITDRIPCGSEVLVRVRHRQPLQNATVEVLSNNNLKLYFSIPQRALANGQYAVLYDNRICLGGGVINN